MHLLLPLKVLPFRLRADVASFPAGLNRDRALSLFQDHDSDLLCVQPADPKSSGRADMAGRQWLGRPRARASGGVHFEATSGYA